MKLSTTKIESLLEHDKDIEKTILYCLIHFQKAREDIKKIKEEDFYELKSKNLFILLRDYIKDVKVFDVHTVPNTIKSNRTYLEIYSTDTNIMAFNWREYFGKLKDVSARRKIQQIALKMTSAVSEDKSIAVIKKEMLAKLNDVEVSSAGKKSKTSKDVIEEDFLPLLDDTNPKGIKTGFTDLDKTIRGFYPGRVYIVGGIPTVGKTTFILNLMQNICRQGKRVLFASLEMSYEDVVTKLISEISNEDMECIRDTQIEATIANKAINGGATIAGYDLHFIGKEAVTAIDIENEISMLGGVDILFIDYLQKIMPINLGVSRYEQVTQISKDITYIATKFGIPVVTVASINRSFANRTVKKPQLSDFRDSGNVEYDVHVALLLYRENQFGDVPKDRENVTEIIFGKNRQGKGGHSIELLFQPEKSKFVQLERSRRNIRKDIYE